VSLLCHVKCENMNLAKFDERAIINGYNAPYRPFYVRLEMTGSKVDPLGGGCGGTIIGRQHVLTGAHCFRDDNTNIPYDWGQIDILVGDMSHPNYRNTVTVLSPISVTVHPGYTGYTEQGYDLAILKLNQTVSTANILPLCAKNYDPGYPIAVCGFGETIGEDVHSDPAQLKETQIQEIVTSGSCGYDYIFNKDLQICMDSIPGRAFSGPCNGDSGGPAFTLNQDHHQPECVYGTVSFGANKYGPTCDGETVFTRVPAFYDWIKNQTVNN